MSVCPAISRVATSDSRGQRRRLDRPNPSCAIVTNSPSQPGGSRREQQRHAIDDERFGDATDQPLAEPQQIEVAVEIAREADERAAVVVAIAVVHAVERGLDRVLHRARQQHDDDRREQRDDRVALILAVQEEPAREPEQDRVDRRDRGNRRGDTRAPRLMMTSTSIRR